MTKINFQGGIDEVKKQIEQTIATYELLGTDSTVSFEQWYERWEQGLPDAVENRALGNYALSGEKAWRGKPENWPRFRRWSNKGGIIEGEYWRDRANKSDSVPLAGTATQLINQIIQLEHQSNDLSNSKSKSKQWPPMKGQPEIKLYFRGNSKAVSETSIRVMTKTDDPKIPLPLIDKSDLRQYANKIKELFATPNLFVWQKGKEVMTYKNRWQGLDGQWWLCRNEAAGRAIITKLVAILDLPLDNSKVRMSRATDEAAAFPSNPPDVIVLGEAVPQDTERPLIDVSFWRAEIILAKTRSPIPLVERGVVVYT